MHGNTQTDWGTPKQIQQLKSREDNRWHSKKNRNICRLTGKEHSFDIVEDDDLFGKPWAKQWRCKCGKKGKREYINPPKWLLNPIKPQKICAHCQRNLIHTFDSITKKKNKHLYYCPDHPDTILSVG